MNMAQHAERRLTYEEAVEETGKFDGGVSRASISLGKKTFATTIPHTFLPPEYIYIFFCPQNGYNL